MIYDYIVKDSTLTGSNSTKEYYTPSSGHIYVGIVREETEDAEQIGTRYVVEIFTDGQQVPISCVPATRFNSPYNFEEFRLKPWRRGSTPDSSLDPKTAGPYMYRDGDTVVVGILNGNMREGIILGGIKHPTRETKTESGSLSYYSVYNGLETKIDDKGAYTVTFQGAPKNDAENKKPGKEVSPEPEYDDEISGSRFGFDETGSFVIDAGSEEDSNFIKLTRDSSGDSITITSGNSTINLAGSSDGEIAVTTGKIAVEAKDLEIKADKSIKAETLELSLKGTQVAIGNDTIELIDGLIQILDGIGQVTVTSPVGLCTPVMASPQWASTIVPLIVKLNTLKGSL